ncbi:hypothetical protein K450DRAFT_237562 [Umbelopsis ramanniana AG]|uniref:Uncharacterized protein n=1 Tax=Umbelopsis ramanniana AG TaxID=1314678 RepID=A0AAD5EC68_UMBRA|nr:uncharacterized protein K450DRAFT_237562 [Umbelopsis ramanniana AG]KAI8580250.1 hypothetical protein K450DRAFT_237562 [Umbelopsis ramanniana AG]
MSVVETFHGYIANTTDSLLLYEACRRGLLPRVSRRLQEKERNCLVRSGSVFVFDEKESGIKRWTDGLVWSPSRILGNFLVYRELDRRASQGGKRIIDPKEQERDESKNDSDEAEKVRERALVGSLTNSYKFKKNGLIKKSMSIVVDGVHQNLISYYDIEDVMAGRLRTPSNVPELAILEISPDFLHKQNFRIPLLIEPGGEVTGEQQQDLPSPPPSSSSSTSSAERRPSTRDSGLPSSLNVENEQAQFMTPQQHRHSMPYYSQHIPHDYQDITGQKRKSTSPHMSDSIADNSPALSNNDTAQLAPIQPSFRPPFGQSMDNNLDSVANLPLSSANTTHPSMIPTTSMNPPNNFSYAYMHVPDRRIDETPLMPPIGRSSGGGGMRNSSPQELFSSQSFHNINQSTMQVRNDAYVTTNSFMSKPALVAGNWSEYDLQM